MRKGFFTVKKICLVLFSVLMMLLVVGCGNSGPKKMVIGLDDNFAPMGFRNEKNDSAREEKGRKHLVNTIVSAVVHQIYLNVLIGEFMTTDQ